MKNVVESRDNIQLNLENNFISFVTRSGGCVYACWWFPRTCLFSAPSGKDYNNLRQSEPGKSLWSLAPLVAWLWLTFAFSSFSQVDIYSWWCSSHGEL